MQGIRNLAVALNLSGKVVKRSKKWWTKNFETANILLDEYQWMPLLVDAYLSPAGTGQLFSLMLAYFNLNMQTEIVVDASPFSLAAILTQKSSEGIKII